MLRIAVCDDNLRFLDDFIPMLLKSFSDVGQQIRVFPFSDGKILLEKVEKEKQIFDIIFMDVQMPVVHGFQAAERLRELSTSFLLIFMTVMEHQSREGYRYGAFRYLFKNHLEPELSEAVSAIMKKLGSLEAGIAKVSFKYRYAGVIENLTLKQQDIVYLQMEKTKRVTLKTLYSEYELLIRPLAEYARQLDPSLFFPIMRNYLLNFQHVESIESGFFVLTGGLTVPLGIKKAVRKASMEKYLKFLEDRI